MKKRKPFVSACCGSTVTLTRVPPEWVGWVCDQCKKAARITQ